MIATQIAPRAIVVVGAIEADRLERNAHGPLMLVLRKLTHFGEYLVLTLLWWWALATRIGSRRALPIAVAIAVGYAITDEIHQTFVDGRVGTPVDVLIDSAGALTAAWLIARARRRRRVAV